MYKKIQEILTKEKRMLWAALGAGFVITSLVACLTGLGEARGVAEAVLRFHVRANSDSPEDQAHKLAVRDAVLATYGAQLQGCESNRAAQQALAPHLENIEALARQTLQARGSQDPVRARLVTEYFPTRQYGDLALPAGPYEALRVDIGAAGGANWWCILFPPLCYVDITKDEVSEETKDQLKTILTDGEYALISKKAIPLKIKFKLVELWQRRGHDLEESY